jgi:hypothetical protein
MNGAVLTKMPEVDWTATALLADAEQRLVKYSSDESRDWRGRWTTGDGDESGENEAAVAINDFTSNGQLSDQDERPKGAAQKAYLS